MACQYCGGELSSSAGVCPRCNTPTRDLATGLLTPPVAAASGPDAATLGFAAATLPPGSDADETGLGNQPRSSRPGDTGPLSPGQDFGSRYHIIRLLGIGGMGAVYQAWDAELGVAVAIKVIRPEVTSDPLAAADVERRFKRELLLARQVTHKNVVRIHDLGEINGIKYITMPYVNGADLATILTREGRLPVDKVMRLARSIVSGLVAAHKAGVVHRDLKPANIMIDADGEAMIMDFGIARSSGGGQEDASYHGTVGSSRLLHRTADMTMAGTVVGTVEYMAPEQARAQPVDQRADVYALGLILYDLLIGRRRAERATSAIAELQGRMTQAPPTAKSIVPEIPEALDGLLTRCLQPDPAARFQTTDEVAAELDRLDGDGNPIPVRRMVGVPLLATVVVLLLALSGGTWWYSRQSLPPAPHDPVSVLIADIENGTGDPTFDRTLEPMLKRALEGAGFITAYDRNAASRTLGVQPPENLNETAARELAVKEGLGVIVSGSLARQGSGYSLSVKATESVTGNVIATRTATASNRDEVLPTAMRLVTAVRTSLGDDTSDSAQLFAMRSLSATSLDVVRHYAAALEASGNNKFDEARVSYLKAVDLDPAFGIGYQGLAAASRNLGNLREAEEYINKALQHVDGMTERERYSTRGVFYFMTGDYQQCVKEFGDLIARYAADVVARNNLALCLTKLRDMPRAQDEMQQVVRILPKHSLYRVNLALYAAYRSDFQAGEQEARIAQELGSPLGLLPLAFAQLGQNQLTQAAETYGTLGTVEALGPMGASYAASGLGDLAVYEGRYSDAVRILGQGAAADLTSKNPDRAAAKFAALAHAHLLKGETRSAVAAAEKALASSNAVEVRFLAARSLIEAGDIARIRPLIDGLASEALTEPQAYAKILEGELALKGKDARQAIKILIEANNLLDTWIGHVDLGRAYLDAGQFVQADSEFDRSIKRRGEALALFLDEEPTYGYLPPVYYYQGLAREGLQTQGFAESYREYLNLRGNSKEDPLLPDIRRRSGAR